MNQSISYLLLYIPAQLLPPILTTQSQTDAIHHYQAPSALLAPSYKLTVAEAFTLMIINQSSIDHPSMLRDDPIYENPPFRPNKKLLIIIRRPRFSWYNPPSPPPLSRRCPLLHFLIYGILYSLLCFEFISRVGRIIIRIIDSILLWNTVIFNNYYSRFG